MIDFLKIKSYKENSFYGFLFFKYKITINNEPSCFLVINFFLLIFN